MRKLNGLFWLCLAMTAGTANADIIIDNQNIPSADISGISITPASGTLVITTKDPGYTVTKNVVGTNVAITNFSLSPTSIVAGGSTTVNWSTANAVSCAATNGVGGWSGSTIGLPTGSKSITAATAGTYTFTLTCNGSEAGDTTTSNVTLTVTAANAVAITSFTASPTTITEGGSTTLSWTTVNAVSCTPTGGAGGWNALTISVPSGSTQVTIPTPGSYSFTLTCQDGSAGTAVKSAVVVVEADNGPFCASAPLAGTQTTWKNFWLVDWPKPTYDNRYATIPRLGWYAIEFNTGNIVSKGKLYTIETTSTDGVRLGAISQCPGDFNVTDECDYKWGISGGISWSTDGSAGCQLAPNTTYYFNVTFTDGYNANTTTCPSSPCITKLQNYNR